MKLIKQPTLQQKINLYEKAIINFHNPDINQNGLCYLLCECIKSMDEFFDLYEYSDGYDGLLDFLPEIGEQKPIDAYMYWFEGGPTCDERLQVLQNAFNKVAIQKLDEIQSIKTQNTT